MSGEISGRLGGRWIERAVAVSVARPTVVLGAWTVLAVLAAFGVARVEIETTTESVLQRNSVEWSVYQDSLDRFGGDEVIVVAFPGAEPFDPSVLERVASLTRALEGTPGVRRVDSLRTVPIVRASPDGTVHLDPALQRSFSGRAEEVEEIRGWLRDDRLSPRVLVSPDGRVHAVNVFLDARLDGYDEIFDRIDELTAGGEAWVSGVPIFRTEVNHQTRREILWFVPVTLLLIALLLLVLFRSWRAPFVSLTVSGLGSWLMVASMGFAESSLSLTTMALPSIMLALGSAYVMHVLMAARRSAEDSLDHEIRQVARPIVLSGLTTALGFLAVTLIRIESTQTLGAFGSLGVLLVTAGAITVAPALLAILPLPRPAPGQPHAWGRGWSIRISRFAERHRAKIIAAWALALGGFGLAWPHIDVQTDPTRWFPPSAEVRQDYERIRSSLSGISPMNVWIRSEEGRAVTAPDVVAAIDGLASHLASLTDVGRVVTLADPLLQLHRGLVGDASADLPDDQALIEQYLLLLDSVEQLDDVLAADHAAANLLLRVDNNGSGALVEVAREAARWWARHGPPDFSARTTGIMYEFARAENEIAYGQLRGLAAAIGAIGVVLLIVLRSPLLAVTSLFPNVIPIVIAFGSLVVAGISLDAMTVVLGCLALGIAVDDTVHVLVRFGILNARDPSPGGALQQALEDVLPALVSTTLVVALGFAVLGLSGFLVTRVLGVVTSALVVLCLGCDLTLLPAILSGLEARRESSAKPHA